MRYSDNSSRTFSFWRDAKDVRCWPPPGFGEGSRSASPIWDMAGSDWDGLRATQQAITYTEMPRALERDCYRHWYAIVFSTSRKTLPNDTGRKCRGTRAPRHSDLGIAGSLLACDLVGWFKGEGCPLHVVFQLCSNKTRSRKPTPRRKTRPHGTTDVGQTIV